MGRMNERAGGRDNGQEEIGGRSRGRKDWRRKQGGRGTHHSSKNNM